MGAFIILQSRGGDATGDDSIACPVGRSAERRRSCIAVNHRRALRPFISRDNAVNGPVIARTNDRHQPRRERSILQRDSNYWAITVVKAIRGIARVRSPAKEFLSSRR